ncbi:hypothetical protein PR048_030409 [Dryococelus australis]|uniref:Uncharacterized protein n=1 Tax=Dryococelus australis TaxID=614101 RepID=A0ABQ9G8W9_9NEOP|nr:hypothetical protein PR048_030409 [Dryococelus australis]
MRLRKSIRELKLANPNPSFVPGVSIHSTSKLKPILRASKMLHLHYPKCLKLYGNCPCVLQKQKNPELSGGCNSALAINSPRSRQLLEMVYYPLSNPGAIDTIIARLRLEILWGVNSGRGNPLRVTGLPAGTRRMERRWNGKREYSEKTRRQAASSSTITTCKNPGVNPSGIEPGLPCWEASALATSSPLPQAKMEKRWNTVMVEQEVTSATCPHMRKFLTGTEPISSWWETRDPSATPQWLLVSTITAKGTLSSNPRQDIPAMERKSFQCSILARPLGTSGPRSTCLRRIMDSFTAARTNAYKKPQRLEALPTHPFSPPGGGGHGGCAVNLLASHQGDPGLRMRESYRTMPLIGRFSRGSPVSPALSFRRCTILISITLIGSQDLDVKSRPTLFTHTRFTTLNYERLRRESSPVRLGGKRVVWTLHNRGPFVRWCNNLWRRHVSCPSVNLGQGPRTGGEDFSRMLGAGGRETTWPYLACTLHTINIALCYRTLKYRRRLSPDRRMHKVMRPMAMLILRKAEEYTKCIQVDLKQGFQKCSFCRERPIVIYEVRKAAAERDHCTRAEWRQLGGAVNRITDRPERCLRAGCQPAAPLTTRLPPRRTGLDPRPGHRVFSCGNRAERCRSNIFTLHPLPLMLASVVIKNKLACGHGSTKVEGAEEKNQYEALIPFILHATRASENSSGQQMKLLSLSIVLRTNGKKLSEAAPLSAQKEAFVTGVA